MVEIETNSNEGYSNRTSKQAVEMPQISSIQEEDVIEKSDNLWVRLQTQFQLEAHYKNPAVDEAVSYTHLRAHET